MFPPSVIPGLFKKSSSGSVKDFDTSDLPRQFRKIPEDPEPGMDDGHLLDALARWRQASQPEIRDLIVMGLEVAAMEVLKEEGGPGHKFNTIIAARDVLWETMKHTNDTKRDRPNTYKR